MEETRLQTSAIQGKFLMCLNSCISRYFSNDWHSHFCIFYILISPFFVCVCNKYNRLMTIHVGTYIASSFSCIFKFVTFRHFAKFTKTLAKIFILYSRMIKICPVTCALFNLTMTTLKNQCERDSCPKLTAELLLL